MGQSKPAAWGQNAISANKMASGAFSRTRKLGCPFQARLFALVAMRLTYRPPSRPPLADAQEGRLALRGRNASVREQPRPLHERPPSPLGLSRRTPGCARLDSIS